MRRVPALLAAAALVLAACGSGDGDGDVGPVPSAADTSAATAVPAPADTASATPTAPAIPEVDIDLTIARVDENPIFDVAKPDFHRFVGAAGFVQDADGVFHTYRTSLATAPGETSLDHFTSADGITWEQQGVGLDPTQVVGDEIASVFINSVMILDDGTWAIWVSDFAGIDAPGFIRRATGPGPEGPWTFDPEPAISPGPAGAWDGISVGAASVHRLGDTWHLWYGGIESRRRFDIGYATSDDGITWTKYDDPATTERRLDPSDPITIGEQEWRPGQLSAHTVIRHQDQWLMIYNGLDSARERGMAVSDDGVTWRPASGNPMYNTDDIAPEAGRVLGGIALLPDGGENEFMILVGSGSPQATRAYAGRATIDIGE